VALRRKRRIQKPGVPEAVAVLLILLCLVTADSYWRQAAQPHFVETSGIVLDSSARAIDYNAAEPFTKATIAYQYTTGSSTYTASWTGSWPFSPESSEKTPPSKGSSISVYYDEADPVNSTLYPPSMPTTVFRHVLFVLPFVVAVVFFVFVYPAWKKRQGRW